MSQSCFWRPFRLTLLLSRDPYVETFENFCAVRPSAFAVRDHRAQPLRIRHVHNGSVTRIAATVREGLRVMRSVHHAIAQKFVPSCGIDDTRLERGEGSGQGRPRVTKP
jgi:hypothetical protein